MFYFFRKQHYSINCQIVGNNQKLICNLVARWAGSTHDARIWTNSNVKQWMEAQDGFFIAGQFYLLGKQIKSF
jgi:DDE superfamily endonuclease